MANETEIFETEILIVNGVEYTLIDSTAVHTVDSGLSTSSSNPVKNSVITAEVNKKPTLLKFGPYTATLTGEYYTFPFSYIDIGGIAASHDGIAISFSSSSAFRPNSTLIGFKNEASMLNGVNVNAYSGTISKSTEIDSNTFVCILPTSGTSSGGTGYVKEGTARMPTGYMKEAYLEWGGKNFSAGNGPLDAALINTLGANRFAFIPGACITVEYSTDAGATWTDYGWTTAEKGTLFAPGIGVATYLGKHSSTGGSANDQLRITVDTYTTKQWVYSAIKKMCVYLSTNGASGLKWTCQVRTTANVLNNVDTWGDIFKDVDIAGYSGINITQTDVVIGSNAPTSTSNTQYRQFRYIFTQAAAHSSGRSAYIAYIMGFGGVGWSTPSPMAKVGSVYDYDRAQNVTFPARVKATELKGLGANYYGTCTTAAGTAAKVVTCTDFVLTAGARISVKFTNGSTSTGPMTLNVNSTGIKNCGAYFHNGLWISESLICNKNDVLEFVYNGTYWVALTPYSLRNFATYYSRLTSANRSNPNMGLEYFSATSAMTTGKPPIDASILNMNWDNGSTYAAQLAVGVGSSTVATPGRIFSRGQLGTAATWSDWKEVPRLSSPLTNGQIVISDESTGNALLKGGPALDTTDTTKFLRHDGSWAEVGGSSYSEGTFTAKYGTVSNTWNYYKEGNTVTVWGSISNATSIAAAVMTGLPFAARHKQVVSATCSGGSYICVSMAIRIESGSTQFAPSQMTYASTSGTSVQVMNSGTMIFYTIGNTATLRFTYICQ